MGVEMFSFFFYDPFQFIPFLEHLPPQQSLSPHFLEKKTHTECSCCPLLVGVCPENQYQCQ